MQEVKKSAYIITGHTKGIGRALTAVALKNGHGVVGISRGKLDLTKNSLASSKFLQYQCDLSSSEKNILNENQIETIIKFLSAYADVIYVINASQNSASNQPTTDILRDIVKLSQINALSQLNLLIQLLSYKRNVVRKCVSIGSYLSFLTPKSSSLGYVISKNLLLELVLLSKKEAQLDLKLQTIILGGVDTDMNRAYTEVSNHAGSGVVRQYFKMAPSKAAELILSATQSNQSLKFIPFLPAIPIVLFYHVRSFFQVIKTTFWS
jgi:short-subunit dehydrogenase